MLRNLPGLAVFAIIAGLIVSTLAVVRASAQDSGLVPDWGGGTLSVQGGGFKPQERVQLVATVGRTQQTFNVTADRAGRFTLNTGMRAAAGDSVTLDAQGNQGTHMAAMTSPPVLPVGEPGDAAPAAGRSARALLPAALVVAALLAAAGWLLYRHRRRPQSPAA